MKRLRKFKPKKATFEIKAIMPTCPKANRTKINLAKKVVKFSEIKVHLNLGKLISLIDSCSYLTYVRTVLKVTPTFKRKFFHDHICLKSERERDVHSIDHF